MENKGQIGIIFKFISMFVTIFLGLFIIILAVNNIGQSNPSIPPQDCSQYKKEISGCLENNNQLIKQIQSYNSNNSNFNLPIHYASYILITLSLVSSICIFIFSNRLGDSNAKSEKGNNIIKSIKVLSIILSLLIVIVLVLILMMR